MTKKLNLATLSKNEIKKSEMQVTGGMAVCRCYCYCECMFNDGYTMQKNEYRMDFKAVYMGW